MNECVVINLTSISSCVAIYLFCSVPRFISAHNCPLVCRTDFRCTGVAVFPIARAVSPFEFSSKRPYSLERAETNKAIPRPLDRMVCICRPSIQLDLSPRRNKKKQLVLTVVWACYSSVRVTQWHSDVIAHSKQLSETNDFVFGRNTDFFHFLNGESYGIFIMRCNHDANLFGIFTFVFQNLHGE